MAFLKLGLKAELITAISDLGYTAPTNVQQQAIPVALAGRDLIAQAPTGTGKTAAFVLPILQQLNLEHQVRAKRVRALILVPTRELALQVDSSIQRLGLHLGVRSMAIFGSSDMQEQKSALIEGVDIVVATPGRLIDLLYQRALQPDALEYLVLDEVDRMLDMGFIQDISTIIERLPSQRQNLLFSATISNKVRHLAQRLLQNPVEIGIEAPVTEELLVDQWIVTVDKDTKSALLSHLITGYNWDQALIFIRTRHGAAKLASQLNKRGIVADALHSGRSQNERIRVLESFRQGTLKFLVTTDVTARGIDISHLSRVVNYDLPQESQDYVHRIGRTGRAGAKGEAISLVSRDDFKNLIAIESRLNRLLERRTFEGFEPRKEVPVTVLNYIPKHSIPKHSIPKNSKHEKNERTQNRAGRRDKTGSKDTNRSQKNNGRPDPWGRARKS